METNTNIPNGADFAPFLSNFFTTHKLDADEVALAMKMSRHTVRRLLTGETYPTERAYSEFCILIGVVEGKDFEAYKKITQEEKDDLAAKIIAGGSSVATVGGMISLISASGVVAGLSAAGITSGLAAIGACVGGGMVAGIATVAFAPLAIGAAAYCLFKPKHKDENVKFNHYAENIDPNFEYEP